MFKNLSYKDQSYECLADLSEILTETNDSSM